MLVGIYYKLCPDKNRQVYPLAKEMRLKKSLEGKVLSVLFFRTH